MNWTAILIAALTFSCASQHLQDQEDALERDFAARDREIGGLEIEADKLRELAVGVVSRYDEATKSYQEAARNFEHARQSYDEASGQWQHAQQDWEAAQKRWRAATLTMLTIAATSQMQGACVRQSTGSFRRELKAKGINLEGKDIDHIIPRSLGGADSASNYRVLDSSVNRSLGNGHVLSKLVDVGPTKAVLALTSTARQWLLCP